MWNTVNNGKSRLEEIFHTGRSSAGEKETKMALIRADRTIRRLEEKGIPDSLKSIWRDIRDLYGMVSAAVTGKYKIPFRTIAAVTFTLLYLANPLDLIPDIIPVVGYIDDAFIVGLCVRFIGSDLEKYRIWKAGENGNEPDFQ